jgi:hypothetical protein
VAPLVADPAFGLENRESDAPARQLVCGGEAGLAAADYHCLQLLNASHLDHLGILASVLMHSIQ